MVVSFQLKATINFMAIPIVVTLLFWSFFQVFVICESSQILCDRFNEIDIYDQCDWYLFSNRIQRALPFIIVNTTQQPAIIKAVGNISCTRETFKNVI